VVILGTFGLNALLKYRKRVKDIPVDNEEKNKKKASVIISSPESGVI
jgi:uncharacterized membrane protein YiaA